MQLIESKITYFKEQTAIIFLTDGQSKNRKATKPDLDKQAGRENIVASQRLKRLKDKCKNFEFYPIKFGDGKWMKLIQGEALNKMAQAVGAEVRNVTSAKEIQNKANNKDALNVVNLENHLEIIAQEIASTSLLVFDE